MSGGEAINLSGKKRLLLTTPKVIRRLTGRDELKSWTVIYCLMGISP